MDSQRVSYVDYMEERISSLRQGFAGWLRIRVCVDRHRTLRGAASDSAGIPGVRASDSACPRIGFGVGPRPSPRNPAGFDSPPRIELCAAGRSGIRPRIELCAAPPPVLHRDPPTPPTGLPAGPATADPQDGAQDGAQGGAQGLAQPGHRAAAAGRARTPEPSARASTASPRAFGGRFGGRFGGPVPDSARDNGDESRESWDNPSRATESREPNRA
ncbi:hypothetical protein Maq22A_c28445 [Methylobacterium aquaticum]|uniref:Uncharacterized protein n=1 Tax=Methylobacterium aquaticum TaxID=270351 RepID=A0A1Y0ZGT1_9HYPH|nr:hypothetical protein Maq22A_c28445 [Methylobacterium aquaticum]